MATLNHDSKITALVVVDPYNDLISEGGKINLRRPILKLRNS